MKVNLNSVQKTLNEKEYHFYYWINFLKEILKHVGDNSDSISTNQNRILEIKEMNKNKILWELSQSFKGEKFEKFEKQGD